MKQRGNFFVFVFVVIAFLQYQIVSFVSNSNNFFKLNIKKIFNNYIHTHTDTLMLLIHVVGIYNNKIILNILLYFSRNLN